MQLSLTVEKYTQQGCEDPFETNDQELEGDRSAWCVIFSDEDRRRPLLGFSQGWSFVERGECKEVSQ